MKILSTYISYNKYILTNNGYIYISISFDLTTYKSLLCTSLYSKKKYTSIKFYSTLVEVEKNKKRLSKDERSKLLIKNPLDEIIIGLLLGDGHIQKRSVKGNSRFIYGQSSLRVNHLNYFNHVLEFFLPYISKDFKQKTRTFKDNRTNKRYSSVNFATLSLPCFNYYRNLFYDSNNLKFVPSDIANLLTPRGLAFWIMDDGSIQNKGIHLNTYGFNSSCVLNLKHTLENMFGKNSLKCSIHKHKKGQRIYIWEESMVLLRNNISQYMHKDMLYKIGS
jgi:hypothetical protein